MTTANHNPQGPDGQETLPLNLQPTLPGGNTGSTVVDSEIGKTSEIVGGATTKDLRNVPERYQSPETIGTGGIGVVTSCLDPNLGRRVAVKTLRSKYADIQSLRVRFVREARVMSQLEHPNIVPVHELGERPDGTVYFTMKQVHGESLEWVLERLEARDAEYLHDYPATRLMDIFVHICQATAFAHSRGVIHRDLKPENIMIGAFGEVQIMDWGLLKVMGGDSSANDTDAIQAAEAAPAATLDGQIAGTPLYMPPEQAAGQIDRLDQRSDLYALGAIFYRVLTRRHYVSGKDVPTILDLVKNRMPTPPHRVRVGRWGVSRELSAICMKALAKRQEDRYQSVQEMIDDIERHERDLPVSVYRERLPIRLWKLGRRHPLASVSLAAAVGLALMLCAAFGLLRHQRYRELLATARQYKSKGDELAGQVFATQIQLNRIRDRWRLKSASPRETVLTRQLERLRSDSQSHYDVARMLYVQAVPMARAPVRDFIDLVRLPGLDRDGPTTTDRRLAPVLRDLVGTYRMQLECALISPDDAETRRLFGMMETWVQRTPGGYDQSFEAWLRRIRQRIEGYGSLHVTVAAPDATTRLYRLPPDVGPPDLDKPERQGGLSLEADPLRQGSYLLLVAVPGRETVRVPVEITEGEPRMVKVRVPTAVPDGTVYVPGGEATIGGDDSPLYRSGQVEIGGFFIKKHEVTFGEYLEFWRQQTAPELRETLMAYVQFEEGVHRRMPAWSQTGELTPPLALDLPIVGISKQAADAYCQWLAGKSGRETRLPTADEWEKAARGVDGRRFPWGNDFQWSYAHLEQTETGDRNDFYDKPGSHPIDRSVYGAMDMAGNVREWTGTPLPESPRRYQIKGGSLATSMRSAICAHASSGTAVPTDIGFRYVVPLGDE